MQVCQWTPRRQAVSTFLIRHFGFQRQRMDFVAAEDVAEGVHHHAMLFEARLAGKAGGADVGAVVDAVEGV